jgi:hypothetical protein
MPTTTAGAKKEKLVRVFPPAGESRRRETRLWSAIRPSDPTIL